MLKWAEVSRHSSEKHFQFLSQYLTENGVPNELETFRFQPEEFLTKIEEIKQNFDQIRIGPPFGEILGASLHQTTSTALTLGACDCLMKQNGGWWPRSILYDAFIEVQAQEKISLDIHANALIVGVGAAARTIFASLLRMGYKKFLFADKFKDRGLSLIEDLKKKYFNAEFRFVGHDELAYLPGSCSVIVNTTPYVVENDLLHDLYYFNYLNGCAYVMDINFEPIEAQLITQAKELGIPTISGNRIHSAVDMLWVRQALGKDLDYRQYNEKLLAFLQGSKT